MSMLALAESECWEILELFREKLPHIPDSWLQELAANYGFDATVDIDPNDVIAILSVPGELHRVQIPLAAHEPPITIHSRLRDELAARGIAPGQIAASLLTIQDSSAKLADMGQLVGRLTSECVSDTGKGWAWYVSKRACKNFCVNGHPAGNCHIARSDDDRRKESSAEGVTGQPVG